MLIYGIQKDGNDNPMCKTARDTDVKNRLLDSMGEARVGWFERIKLKHVYYHMLNR